MTQIPLPHKDQITVQGTPLSDALKSNGTESLLVQEDTPLDASAAEIDIDINSQTLSALSTDLAPALGSNATDSLLVDSNTSLDVSAATVPVEQQTDVAVTASATGGLAVEQQTPVGVEDSGGVQIDPATETTLTEISQALASTGSTNQDSLLVDSNSPLDVSAATVTVNEPNLSNALASTGSTNQDSLLVDSNTALDVSAATVPVEQQTSVDVAAASTSGLAVEQQTPVGVEDSTGTQVDPAKNVNGSSTTASAAGTGSANAAALTVPDGRNEVTVAYDTSGAASITVEVSPDSGTTWYPLTSFSPGSATANADTLTVGFDDVRAYINQNLNSLHIGAKGV